MTTTIETFRNNQYTITSSLSDHHIIINVTNNVSYVCYEGKFDQSAFRISFGLPAVFKLINKCFAEFITPTGDSSYKASIGLDDNSGVGIMIVDFHCLVDGFLDVTTKIRLPEKRGTAGDNNGLYIEFNLQKQLVAELTERMAEMEKMMKLETSNILARQQQTIDELVEMEKKMKLETSNIIARQQQIIDGVVERIAELKKHFAPLRQRNVRHW